MGWKIDRDRPAVEYEVAVAGRPWRSGYICDDLEIVGRSADRAAAARDALIADRGARARLPE